MSDIANGGGQGEKIDSQLCMVHIYIRKDIVSHIYKIRFLLYNLYIIHLSSLNLPHSVRSHSIGSWNIASSIEKKNVPVISKTDVITI